MQASSSFQSIGWREETRQLLGRLGFQRGTWLRSSLVHAAVGIAFGFLVPYQKGADFLDSVILGAYMCLSVVFAAPAAAASFESPPGSFKVALERVVLCVLYGTLLTFSAMVAGVIVVYATHTIVVGPDLQAVGELALFALMLALAVTSAVAWMSVRYSPRVGKGTARVVFMGLLLLFFLNVRRLPDVALTGAAISAICAMASLLLLWKVQTR